MLSIEIDDNIPNLAEFTTGNEYNTTDLLSKYLLIEADDEFIDEVQED